jgi:mycobactin lysine-N-oxygenase
MPTRIAVIGGGPKAAAIAAKAAALAAAGYDAPEVVIFEAWATGAAWSGKYGYTDGEQLLCTPAERDLGYPYDPGTFGADVARRLFSVFSWHGFLSSGRRKGSYPQWVNRGRQPPVHAEFAEYVNWAIDKSGPQAKLQIGTVADLSYRSSRGWQVRLDDGSVFNLFDGVVVTGAGPPKREIKGVDNRVLDGQSFWPQRGNVWQRLANEGDPKVVVVGAGGTAAAVVDWLLQQRPRIRNLAIQVVGLEATLHTRSPGYFEDRMFGDDDGWQAMSAARRRKFVDRLTRGVVWSQVLERLTHSGGVEYLAAKAVEFKTNPPLASGVPGEFVLVVDPETGAPKSDLPATVFIDCCGFDRWWFRSLFSRDPAAAQIIATAQSQLEESINADLSLSAPFPHSNLHAPMAAAMAGPAAPNLMALGWMSDCILLSYIDNAERLRRVGLASGP